MYPLSWGGPISRKHDVGAYSWQLFVDVSLILLTVAVVEVVVGDLVVFSRANCGEGLGTGLGLWGPWWRTSQG